MDLNELLSRHQVSLAKASLASSAEAKLSHLGLAKGYAFRIREIRGAAGVTAALTL